MTKSIYNQQHSEDTVIDLVKMAQIAGKRWPKLLIIIILFSIISFFGTLFLIPKKYTASSKVIIVSKNDNSSQSISYTEVETAQKLTATYTKIMQSEAISDIVIKNLNLNKLDYDNKTYNKVVSVTAEGTTEVMNISATTEDPQLSADIANEVVNVFTKQIYDIMQIENITVLNTAKVPVTAASPSVIKNTAFGELIGFFIDGFWVIFITMHDTKLKTEEDIKEVLDYPVIGMIPEFKIGKNAGDMN